MNCDINILKNSNNKNKLTIFIGAGVSKSSNLPSWSDLIEMIKSELSINDSETDYLKIAQLYYLSCGEVVYYKKISVTTHLLTKQTNYNKISYYDKRRSKSNIPPR